MPRLTTTSDPVRKRIWRPVTGAMLPWFLLLVVGTLALSWPPFLGEATVLRWAWLVAEDAALILPFLLFAAGVALARILGYSRRVRRAAVAVGFSVAAASYGLGSWVAPVLDDRYLAGLGSETEDMRRFGAQTPVGITRNIRFVEANPPETYELRANAPHRLPPNVLRWELHAPLALAVFGILNVFIGALAAELTIHLTRGSRRNARMAIGVVGGIAFFAGHVLASPAEPFMRDGSMRSGVIGAWLPLGLPVAELLILSYLVRGRRY